MLNLLKYISVNLNNKLLLINYLNVAIIILQ
jgi:hypothetical protein